MSQKQIDDLLNPPVIDYGDKKKCNKCEEIKPRSEFNARTSSKDGLQSTCRICNKAGSKDRYKLDDKYKDASRIRKFKLRNFISEYKTAIGCEKCGYNVHPVALDLHHIGEKTNSISQLIYRGSAKAILEELKKCIVLCANCHRIETWAKENDLELIAADNSNRET